jgi:hypothetical protein
MVEYPVGLALRMTCKLLPLTKSKRYHTAIVVLIYHN